MSRRSSSLPYVAMFLLTVIFAARVYVYRARHLLREFCILGLTCLVIASNHFPLVGLVRDGQKEVEFKQLAEWYTANAKPGEKLGVYMAGVVKMFTPDRAEYIVHLPKADDPQKFIEACYEKDITYVVWATREGARGGHTGYRQIGLDRNIADLRNARDTGPYEFVAQVGSKNAWVNIFRLRKPAAAGPGAPSPG